MNVTSVAGFRASGMAADLNPSWKSDVALVVHDSTDHVAAAVFTSNHVKAACVACLRQFVTDGCADIVARTCRRSQHDNWRSRCCRRVRDRRARSVADCCLRERRCRLLHRVHRKTAAHAETAGRSASVREFYCCSTWLSGCYV